MKLLVDIVYLAVCRAGSGVCRNATSERSLLDMAALIEAARVVAATTYTSCTHNCLKTFYKKRDNH